MVLSQVTGNQTDQLTDIFKEVRIFVVWLGRGLHIGSNEIGQKELGRPFWSNNLGRID